MKRLAFAFLVILSIGLLLPNAWAHEGHNHQPGAVTSPHGGVMQSTPQYYVEVVKLKGGVQVFIFDHALKAISHPAVLVTGKVTFPKKKDPTEVQFTSKDNSFEAKIDAQGSHRYTLNLEVANTEKRDKPEKVSFQIEPME